MNPVKGNISEVLMRIIREIGTGSDEAAKRQAFLRDAQVRFRHEGILHQIFDYERGAGAWVAACGIQYPGNSYVETSQPGDSTCMGCIAEE